MNAVAEIARLKKERHAVILAHNYQLPEVQDIADYTGDSLGLSLEAAKTKAEVIIFCGVYFMAETAKIISPEKTVVIPDPTAGCPMADMVSAAQLRELKARHPQAKVVCYVNTTAEVKAECDVCCTSANAVLILKKLKKEAAEIIFVPDKYLAGYAAQKAGCAVIPWPGYCPTHARILPEHIVKLKQERPMAKVIVHPECNGLVVALADAALSTAGMIKYASENDAEEFIVATETGMLHGLRKACPRKRFYPVSEEIVCPNMKKTTLEKVLRALQTLEFQVELPGEIINRARLPIQRMMDWTKKND
ncbi:MAG: quinolinate synthase NadA [Candidatus Omnitrophica bacterium]|nr:quinolinate synthase NadA [Candidatus Omnitrophota bacterium]